MNFDAIVVYEFVNISKILFGFNGIHFVLDVIFFLRIVVDQKITTFKGSRGAGRNSILAIAAYSHP